MKVQRQVAAFVSIALCAYSLLPHTPMISAGASPSSATRPLAYFQFRAPEKRNRYHRHHASRPFGRFRRRLLGGAVQIAQNVRRDMLRRAKPIQVNVDALRVAHNAHPAKPVNILDPLCHQAFLLLVALVDLRRLPSAEPHAALASQKARRPTPYCSRYAPPARLMAPSSSSTSSGPPDTNEFPGCPPLEPQ